MASSVSARVNFFDRLARGSRGNHHDDEDEEAPLSRNILDYVDVNDDERRTTPTGPRDEGIVQTNQVNSGGSGSVGALEIAQNVPNVAVNLQKEMKRYQPFSLAMLAGVITMTVFVLSTGNNLNNNVRFGIMICLIVMVILAAMAVATAYANDADANEENTADAPALEGSLGCTPGATVSRVSISLLLLLLYIVDISLLHVHSYLHGGGTGVPPPSTPDADMWTILLPVAILVDTIVALLWINIWKRPQNIYTSSFMVRLRAVCWIGANKLFTMTGCASSEEAAASPPPPPPPQEHQEETL